MSIGSNAFFYIWNHCPTIDVYYYTYPDEYIVIGILTRAMPRTPTARAGSPATWWSLRPRTLPLVAACPRSRLRPGPATSPFARQTRRCPPRRNPVETIAGNNLLYSKVVCFVKMYKINTPMTPLQNNYVVVSHGVVVVCGGILGVKAPSPLGRIEAKKKKKMYQSNLSSE